MNKKYSDDEIIKAYARLGTQQLVSKELGCSQSVVSNALKRNGIKADGYKRNGKRSQKISDGELVEACKTLSSGEIQQRYDIKQCSLYERCKRLGISPVKKKQKHNKGLEKMHRRQSLFAGVWHYWEPHAKKFENRTDFEYCESKGAIARLKCKKCGAIIERRTRQCDMASVKCEYCSQKEKDLQQSRLELIGALQKYSAYKEPRICACCGKSFHSINARRIYCSNTCKNIQIRRSKPQPHSYRGRCRKYGVFYDPSVKREEVFTRDQLVCQICGKRCDFNDRRWGTSGPDYPTLDHIIPLARGGTHTRGNIQCACGMCNSIKRDLLYG